MFKNCQKLYQTTRTLCNLNFLQLQPNRVYSKRIKWSRRRFYSTKNRKTENIDLTDFPPERIRNFCIIAHVDHGKSTLADRMLEITGVIPENQKNEQVLDKLQVERERGITVKAQSASLFYDVDGTTYLLNLVDTPGHVDFSYEVSRSLSACQGVILLVDANQGVQAQTVANMYLAIEAGLEIIPVLNKIDLKGANPELVSEQIQALYPVTDEEILKISAKFGKGVDEVIKAVIKRIPSPPADPQKPLKALVYDSWYDKFKGIICNIAVKDGSVSKGDKVTFCHALKSFDIQEVGLLHPEQTPTNMLLSGQVGYVIANVKSNTGTLVGDTMCHKSAPVDPLPGFRPAKPMVFAGIYPVDQSQYTKLRESITKLTFNDSSVSMAQDSSAALGAGWRLGFLGLLHMDVFKQRLEQEFDANLIITAPNIPYKVKIIGAKNIKQYKGEEVVVLNPCKLPDQAIISQYYEPMVRATVVYPDIYVGEVQALITERRGRTENQTYLDNSRVILKVIFPLNEILIDFFDALKSVTKGYASFDYEDYGYEETNLSKVSFTVNTVEVEEMTVLCHSSSAQTLCRKICARLQEAIPRQQFKVQIKGQVNNKHICTEVVNPYRKDVTQKLYGGDVTRRNKLLAKQAQGKKRMRSLGNVQVPKDVFIKVLTQK
ncbi:translation factor Guf1, mitochondrial-like isoform X1 [Ostrea edulis]|uniref:translation factor Guf1, mitochondrial-like isoform X1 n=1 Tax=Ostrea edulis TaxID=37623 RepID=UPI002094D334|nr:translation factor Guf1, mitochondrial-like isoform X1 [Ostrea edulis]